MLFTVERNHFLKALIHITGVVERRNTVPILSHLLLDGEGGTLTLTATDLDLEITEDIAAVIERPGRLALQAHTLHDIVRKFRDGAQVKIEADDDNTSVTISSGHAKFQLQTLSADDFPRLEADEFSTRFEIKASLIKLLLEKTRFAMSVEETRYYLNGVFMHPVQEEGEHFLRMVATDGHRLARCQVELPSGADDVDGVIIPRKTVNELYRLTESGDENILVEMSDQKIRFHLQGVVLMSKVIDGTFPDYVRVIPQGNNLKLSVINSDFRAAVDRVAILSSEKGKAVKLSTDKDQLVVSVNNPDSGRAEEELVAEYDDQPIEIGFNARYLLDIAGLIDGETATFLMSDPGAPTIVQDMGNEGALYVIMPMRV